jgi:hypothetical protein
VAESTINRGTPTAEVEIRAASPRRWRALQAVYVVGCGLLGIPAYALIQADLDLLAVLYTALAIVALTLGRHRVLARELRRLRGR